MVTLLLVTLGMIACDCRQQATGVILDRQTKIPIDSVIIATSDITQNTITGKVTYSSQDGEFKFDKISSGPGSCPDLTLYFYKAGFGQKKLTFSTFSEKDTVYLENVNL